MDTKEMQGDSECGGCGECKHGMGGGCCRHRRIWHILVKVLVALFIFWAGVQVGELKGILRGYGYGGGYGMMGAYRDNAGQNYFYSNAPGGMMGGWLRTGTSTGAW